MRAFLVVRLHLPAIGAGGRRFSEIRRGAASHHISATARKANQAENRGGMAADKENK